MNAASAEESAAAAVQMNAQSAALLATVAELSQLVHGARASVSRLHEPEAGAPLPATVAPNSPSAQAAEHLTASPRRATGDLVQWDPAAMATGVAKIDEQHQQLITMINRLHHACREGRGKAEVREMMTFLADYVQTHFRDEEEIMARHNCPSKAANKAAHAKFLRDFTDLAAAFESDQNRTAVVLDLGRLVGDWLRNHICSIDRKLRGCPGAQTATHRATAGAIAAKN
jgi:hemerythrin